MPAFDNVASARAMWVIKITVLVSVVAYFIEVEVIASQDSLHGPALFLWLERMVALILTAEYAMRLREAGRGRRLAYAFSPLGVVDLLSILPFWAGFLVPDRYLGMVRTLRVLRLAKFYRYSEGLQSLFEGLRAEAPRIRAVGQVVLMVLAFSTAAIHATESAAQPDKFGKLSHCLWWSVVTMTTVGYGDSSPITNPGRIVAILLMFVGIGVVSAFVGIVGGAMFRSRVTETLE
jgi:voltage-gated potassium channel